MSCIPLRVRWSGAPFSSEIMLTKCLTLCEQTEVKAESGIDGCYYFREYQPMGGIIETCQNRVDVWRLSPSAIVITRGSGHFVTVTMYPDLFK